MKGGKKEKAKKEGKKERKVKDLWGQNHTEVIGASLFRSFSLSFFPLYACQDLRRGKRREVKEKKLKRREERRKGWSEETKGKK